MHFSLTAKPPKPKPKKAKDKVVVMRTGRGGGGNIKRKKVPKTPPNGADIASITSGVAISPSPAPQADATSSQLSRIGSGITHTSKTGSSNSTPDMGEAEDKIKAPAGREILSAKHRKIYSGRGGAGNAHKLLADDSVYERVLLHEQGIVQAYNEERKEREARSTGRGGSGNIRKKKSAGGSDTSSTRTRSSGRSWGSIARRYRNAQGTTTQSSLSLSPIPSLQGLPNNDFGSSLEKGIFEQAIFERASEDDDAPVAGPSTSQAHPSTAMERQKPIKVILSTDMDIADTSRVANITTSPTGASKPALWLRTPASKPISPSAIASGSWIANRLQETSALSRSRPPNVSPPPLPLSSGSSSSSLAGRGKSVPPNTRLSHNTNSIPLSSSPPVLDITISPSTTPTSNVMNMRRAASSNALNSAVEMTDEQMTTVRPRQNPAMLNQANRNASIYKSHDSLSSSASEDAIALYRAYSQESLDSTLPYLNPPSSSTPRAPSTMKHLVAQRPPSRPLPSSPSASKTLELPHTAADAIRHSRHMSSSDTSGSELDLARYNFPDAPGHQPRVLPREVEPASLHMLMEERSAEGMMVRYPSEPLNAPTPQSLSPPPRTSSRAPVQPGAYQSALRSILDDVPDGPPPLYQPRASRKYSVDPSQDQYYPEPPTPTSYSPHRVASPSNVSVRSNPDTSPTILRPSLRPVPSASPLSEVHTPIDGSPLEKYPSESRMNEKAYPLEKSPPIITRSGAGRRPSDPYQRLLAATSKNSPPHTPTRRGSSPYVTQQTLSPHMATHPHAPNGEHVESPTEYSDPRSRPPSQAFSTYTRGTRHSTWGASQATATAVDHHDGDFPNMEEDDGVYYSSMFGDIDGYENERGRAYREALVAKGMRLNGKEPDWLHPNFAPPLPEIPKHLLTARNSGVLEPAASRSPSRQLPTPPIGPSGTPPPAPHPYFPGGMGWDELNRPPPRKLSKMEKALLRRVEFGAGAAADIASIPLA